MSTRHEHRGHNSAGRGHSHRSERIRNTTAHAPPGGGRFTGLNTQLPILDYGSTKHNKPIAFLITMGEHCSVTYRKSIAFAFGTTPPEYGIERDAPEYPDFGENTTHLDHQQKAQISEYLNDKKSWSTLMQKIEDELDTAFSVVLRTVIGGIQK